jgi:hypothetical protein
MARDAAFVFFGALAAAFTLDPATAGRSRRSFALGRGRVMAGIAWHVLRYEEAYAGRNFAFAAGVIASVIACRCSRPASTARAFPPITSSPISTSGPMRSARGRARLYRSVVADAGAARPVAPPARDRPHRELMREEWFGWAWSGGAFGAALGVLRNNLKIIGTCRTWC